MTNQEKGLTRQQVFSELAKSTHRDLAEYLPVGQVAAKEDPEFFAHLIAWNARKGKVRDSQVALPLVAVDSLLAIGQDEGEFRSNALAHLALLSPRDLLRGVRFAKEQKLRGRRNAIPKLVKLYLQAMEQNPAKWERTAVRHRRTMHELYSLCRVKPSTGLPYSVLFNEDEQYNKMVPPGGVFESIRNLRTMSDIEAAGEVAGRKLPFLVAAPALGGSKLDNGDVMVALMGTMTPPEIQGHMKMFERRGVLKNPALRGALEKALGRVITSSKASALKISKALEVSERDGSTIEDDDLREKLKAVQEKKLDRSSVDGDWLVAGDDSSSMSASIELAKKVASVLARSAKGDTHLVFFNTSATYYNVTGKTLDEIVQMTRHVRSGGNTSIGVALSYAAAKKLNVDGIVVISDGGENTAPMFASAYAELCKQLDRRVPVYFYRVSGDPDRLSGNCAVAEIELVTFDVGSSTDYYSLPNLVETMRTNRYSLVDEIMEVPLLTLDQVLKLRQPVHA